MSFLFNVIVVLAIAGIAYIHWIQGLLSGVISMVIAIVAASMAMAYYESLGASLMPGSEYAHPLMLPCLFGVIYIVLRMVFDAVVPGNVRVPHLMDKIGGAACGFVAAIFCMGVVTLGAQTLPVGPDVVLWSRYEIEDREATAEKPNSNQKVDAMAFGVLKEDADKLAANEQGLWLPVDRWVSSFVKGQSASGALANGRPFAAVHPDLPNELFFQRMGAPVGFKRTATSFARSTPDASIKGKARTLKVVREADAATQEMRKDKYVQPSAAARPGTDGRTILAIPLSFTSDAAEKDGIFRVSPGQIRLVAPESGKTYYPVGTLYRGNVLVRNRLDDMIYIATGNQKHQDETGLAVFVFEVDANEVFVPGATPNSQAFKPGTFVEVKKLNYLPLADVAIAGPDLNHFPDGSGFASRIESAIDANGGIRQDVADPVLRRKEMLKEYGKLDKGPDPTALGVPVP